MTDMLLLLLLAADLYAARNRQLQHCLLLDVLVLCQTRCCYN